MSKNQTEYIRADRYEKLKARYLDLWEAHRTALPPELEERVRGALGRFVKANYTARTPNEREDAAYYCVTVLRDILSAIGESDAD
jgi:hypothetical protein